MRSPRRRHNLPGLHRRNKPVPAARECFNVSRRLGGVTEHLAKARNRIMQTMVEIDESVGRPNLGAQLLASDHIAGAIQNSGQHLQRLALQAQPYTVFPQLTGANIQFEVFEAQYARAW
jgi:hypothetical protein